MCAWVIFCGYEWKVARLDSAIAFTTLTLLNVMRFPLIVLPKALRALSGAHACCLPSFGARIWCMLHFCRFCRRIHVRWHVLPLFLLLTALHAASGVHFCSASLCCIHIMLHCVLAVAAPTVSTPFTFSIDSAIAPVELAQATSLHRIPQCTSSTCEPLELLYT